MKLVIGTSPLSVELHTAPRGRRPGQRFQPLAMPDNLYRVASRRVIRALLAENRDLRHSHRPVQNINVHVRPATGKFHRAASILQRLAPGDDE